MASGAGGIWKRCCWNARRKTPLAPTREGQGRGFVQAFLISKQRQPESSTRTARKKAIRFDQRGLLLCGRLRRIPGGQTEGSAYAHRPQPQRYRATAGEWNVRQRAQTFRDTPMQFSVDWSRAQLGQLTKSSSSGTVTRAGEERSTSIWRWRERRQSCGPAAALRSRISGATIITSWQCCATGGPIGDAEYSSLTHEFHEVLCSAPVAQGLVSLSEDVGLPGSHRFAVLVKAENVRGERIERFGAACEEESSRRSHGRVVR